MSVEIRCKPYWGFYGDPIVAVLIKEKKVVTFATAPDGIEMWITIEERFEVPTEEEMKLLPPKKEWLNIDDTNEDFYLAKYREDPKSLSEEELSALKAHLFVKTIIRLDEEIRGSKNRGNVLREERNKLSKEIPHMSVDEKEKAILRVREIKEELKGYAQN